MQLALLQSQIPLQLTVLPINIIFSLVFHEG